MTGVSGSGGSTPTVGRVVLVGGGGHASDILGLIEDLIASGSSWAVAGLLDDTEVDTTRFEKRGVRQIGSINELPTVDASHYALAVGWPSTRRGLHQRARTCGLEAATLIHPSATVGAQVFIGEGTQILSGAVVSPLASLGAQVLVSYNSAVGHDSQIGDYASIMPAAVVSGACVVGSGCMIGTNATVIEGRNLGPDSTIGAGAVVLRDVERAVTVAGVPAAPI